MEYDATTWQVAVLQTLLLKMMGHDLPAAFLASELADAGLLKAPFTSDLKWSDDMVECVRETVPGFRSPAEVVGAYADELVLLGVLTRTRKGWRAVYEVASASRSNEGAAVAGRRRGRRVEQEVASHRRSRRNGCRDCLGRPRVARRVLDAGSGRERGGDAWVAFGRKLEALAAMMQPHGSVVPELDLLGLPLERQRLKRWRNGRPARLGTPCGRGSPETDRGGETQESLNFVAEMQAEAEAVFGKERGRGWIEERLAPISEEQRREWGYDLHARDKQRIADELRSDGGGWRTPRPSRGNAVWTLARASGKQSRSETCSRRRHRRSSRRRKRRNSGYGHPSAARAFTRGQSFIAATRAPSENA